MSQTTRKAGILALAVLGANLAFADGIPESSLEPSQQPQVAPSQDETLSSGATISDEETTGLEQPDVLSTEPDRAQASPEAQEAPVFELQSPDAPTASQTSRPAPAPAPEARSTLESQRQAQQSLQAQQAQDAAEQAQAATQTQIIRQAQMGARACGHHAQMGKDKKAQMHCPHMKSGMSSSDSRSN